jgi:hypothetical protein
VTRAVALFSPVSVLPASSFLKCFLFYSTLSTIFRNFLCPFFASSFPSLLLPHFYNVDHPVGFRSSSSPCHNETQSRIPNGAIVYSHFWKRATESTKTVHKNTTRREEMSLIVACLNENENGGNHRYHRHHHRCPCQCLHL